MPAVKTLHVEYATEVRQNKTTTDPTFYDILCRNLTDSGKYSGRCCPGENVKYKASTDWPLR